MNTRREGFILAYHSEGHVCHGGEGMGTGGGGSYSCRIYNQKAESNDAGALFTLLIFS